LRTKLDFYCCVSVTKQLSVEALAADSQVRIAKELIKVRHEMTAIRQLLEKIAAKGSGLSG